jgi:hypothetical protein
MEFQCTHKTYESELDTKEFIDAQDFTKEATKPTSIEIYKQVAIIF